MSTLIRIVFTLLFATSLSLFNLAAVADPGGQGHGQGKGQGHGHGNPHGQKGGDKHETVHGHAKNPTSAHPSAAKKTAKFSSGDRTVITNYFHAHSFTPSTLPPGIAMNVARGKPLPPGIAKRYLPNDLVTTLPTYPGEEYVVVGRDVVLLNESTGIVTDILANILK